MVTVAVSAVLLAIAAPSFSDFINTSRLATQSNDILAALNLARSEALRLGQRVVFCRSEPPFSTCIGGAGDWKGWLVFVDVNDSSQFDAGEVMLRTGAIDAAVITVGASPALVSAANRVAFRPDGLARPAGTTTPLTAALMICKSGTSLAENARTLFIAAGSRMALTKGGNAGCAAPPNTQS